MDPILAIFLIVAISIIVGVCAFFIGVQYRKKVGEDKIGSAETEAKRIIEEAQRSAEATKKEAVIAGKDEAHRLLDNAEHEIADRRKEMQRQERRIQQKEESVEKKLDSLEKKDEATNQKLKKAEERLAEAEKIRQSELEVLERISGFTSEQAKAYILNNLDSELTHEKAVKIMDFQQKTKEEAEKTAREIISLAIQRIAADHVSESTVSVVPLPNDDMKGRIIGREGRNIRAIETLTGVDLIIDDTPEAITLSCFEPVKREIAKVTLTKLISDGRIHPARIEEMYEKAKREVEFTVKSEGERAIIEAGVNNIHPELVKLIGRLHFRTSYGQNVLEHSLEVAYLAGIIASELGLDPTMARRAGLLHDIGKVKELSSFPQNDYTDEGQLLGHIVMGSEMIADHIREIPGFPEKLKHELQHCILAHHGQLEFGSPKVPELIEAMALNLADNTDAKLETLTELLGEVTDTRWLGYNRFLDANIRKTTDGI